MTINNTYTLPTASSSVLGGIKVGSGLSIDAGGVLSIAFNIPTASPTLLGGVKVGAGLSIDSTGVLSTILPVASSVGLGGIKVGSGLAIDGAGVLSVTAGGTGTVTSVGLSLPSIFSVSGSPVTGAGTLSGTLASQGANLVFAGPTTGVAAAPTFRSLVAGDIPSLDAGKITTGTLPAARLPANIAYTDAASGLSFGHTASITGSPAYAVTYSGTVGLTGSTTAQTFLYVAPHVLQTGTASYAALVIDPSEGTLGSGTSYLLDIRKNGTSQFQIQSSQPHTYLNSSASSTSFPTTFGMSNFGTGNAARWQFGDTNTCLQNSFGGSLQVISYHGLQLYGRANGINPAFGSNDTAATQVYVTNAADIGLLVQGAASQSADLQRWISSSGSVLASVSSSGAITSTGTVTAGARAAPFPLTSASGLQTADTTMTTANTFYDGPTLSCVAGTWLLLASCTVLATATAGKVTGKLWDGTTVLTSTEQPQVASSADSLTLCYVVSPTVTTTYKMSVASTVAGNTLKAACPDNAAGNNASWIVAVRIA